MSKLYFQFLLLIAGVTVQIVSAQEGAPCRTSIITPRHFFNMSQFVGDWYIQEYALADSEAVGVPSFSCLSVNISATSNPYNYVTTERFINTTLNSTMGHTDVLIIESLQSQAYWERTYYTSGGTLLTDSVILHTDYTSWMIEYGCTMRGTYRHETIAFWSRARDISSENVLKTTLRTLLIGLGMPTQNRIVVDQITCV